MTSPTSSSSAVSGRLDLALLIFRIAGALVFLYHGSAILFGAFGGPGIQGFAGFMHYPAIVGVLVGLAQFAGGLALLTGVFVRVGALCIMIVMAGAIFLVHLPHGFNLANNGMEYALTQFLLALGLLLAGGGAYSLAGILPPALRKL
ncbi:MAG: DoxX family protein [Candidatus Acidiferrales bacterium]